MTNVRTFTSTEINTLRYALAAHIREGRKHGFDAAVKANEELLAKLPQPNQTLTASDVDPTPVYVQPTHAEKIAALKDMLAKGEFNHATYREIGKLHEGLYIYKNEDNGFNGFDLAFMFPKGAEEEDAYALVRHTGVSFGSRGNG